MFSPESVIAFLLVFRGPPMMLKSVFFNIVYIINYILVFIIRLRASGVVEPGGALGAPSHLVT